MSFISKTCNNLLESPIRRKLREEYLRPENKARRTVVIPEEFGKRPNLEDDELTF